MDDVVLVEILDAREDGPAESCQRRVLHCPSRCRSRDRRAVRDRAADRLILVRARIPADDGHEKQRREKTHLSTATASDSVNLPRWVMRSNSSPPTASSNER